jgi:hypothetical protein
MLLNIHEKTKFKNRARAASKQVGDRKPVTIWRHRRVIFHRKTDMVYSSVRDSVRRVLMTQASQGTRPPHIKTIGQRIAAGEKKERAGECLPEVVKTAHGSLIGVVQC